MSLQLNPKAGGALALLIVGALVWAWSRHSNAANPGRNDAIGPRLPSMPDMPGMPAVSGAVPNMPAMPRMPDMPSMPAMPRMPW